MAAVLVMIGRVLAVLPTGSCLQRLLSDNGRLMGWLELRRDGTMWRTEWATGR